MAARKPLILNGRDFEQLQPGDTLLGLQIGVDIQAHNAGLDVISTLDGMGLLVRSGDNVYSLRSIVGNAGRITVANGDGAANDPAIDLATLADDGGGSLLKITRDSWGRVAGSSAVTADDIGGLVDLRYVRKDQDNTLGNGITVAYDAATTVLADNDLIPKWYADAIANGLDWKGSVRVATTANVVLVGGAPNAVDGVTLAANDRVLVKNQSTASQNGIYTVQTLGTGANGTWVRASDANSSAEVTSGMTVWVSEGTSHGDSAWTLVTNDVIALNTTALAFTQTSGLGQITSVFLDNTGLKIRDLNASHGLIIAPGSDLTTDRTLTLVTGDASRTLTLTGNPTLADWFDQSVKTTASPTFVNLMLTGGTQAHIVRSVNNSSLDLWGGNGVGARLALLGSTHIILPNWAVLQATTHVFESISGTDKLVLDSDGAVLCGSTAVSYKSVFGRIPGIAQVWTLSDPVGDVDLATFSNSGFSAALNFIKGRGTSPSTASIVQNGDNIGALVFSGVSGAGATTFAAAMFAQVDGTPGATNDMPGRLVFQTVPNGSGTLTEALRLSQDQSALFANSIKSNHATAGIGYATGAGGTVTQLTNKATGVTLNKVCGAITMHNAALAANANVTFTVTNSAVAAGDTVYPVILSGGTTAAYLVRCTAVGAGTFNLTVTNISAGSLSEAVVITFFVLKGVTA